MLRPLGLFAAYRFAIRLVDHGRDELLPVHSIFQDPFTSMLWVGRAHMEGVRPLMQSLVEAKTIEVWLLPLAAGHHACRCLPIELRDKPRWFPLDLDASRGEAALEWVCWSDCQIGGSEHPLRDIPADEVPLSIRRLIDPRSQHE